MSRRSNTYLSSLTRNGTCEPKPHPKPNLLKTIFTPPAQNLSGELYSEFIESSKDLEALRIPSIPTSSLYARLPTYQDFIEANRQAHVQTEQNTVLAIVSEVGLPCIRQLKCELSGPFQPQKGDPSISAVSEKKNLSLESSQSLRIIRPQIQTYIRTFFKHREFEIEDKISFFHVRHAGQEFLRTEITITATPY